jgi:hypothetical protein
MRSRVVTVFVVALVLLAVGVAGVAAYLTFFDPNGPDEQARASATMTPATPRASVTPKPSPTPCPTAAADRTIGTRVAPAGPGPRAVILDEAGLTVPNRAFVESTMALLQQAGYVVDYYGGTDVTVDLFRGLPEKNYEFIIFRGHSAALFDNLVLFTSEPYSDDAHLDDQRGRRLVEVHWNAECLDEPRYFGIMPDFIRSLDGGFQGATVLITGCWGLNPDSTAAAFVEQGASVVLGWDGLVSADHTDAATERVLQHLLVDRVPAAQAVEETMTELGPDPAYGSRLGVYPAQE